MMHACRAGAWAWALAAALVSAAAQAQPVPPPGVEITVLAPLTGRAAGLGEQMRVGAMAAAAAINAQAGAGGALRVVVEDDACSPREAVSVIQRVLARTAGTVLLVGPLCSGAAAAIQPLLAEETALAMVPAQMDALTAAPANQTAGGLPVLFRVTPANGMIAGRLVAALQARQPQGGVAVVTAHDAFGRDIRAAALAALAARGRAVAVEAELASGERDFTAIITRLKAAGVAAVIFGGYASEAGPFLRQMREQGLAARLYGPGTLSDRETCSDRAACEGVIVAGSDQWSAGETPARARLRAVLGREAEDGEAFAATAVEVLAAAVAAGGTLSAASVRQALLSGTFASVTGPVRFARSGERIEAAVRLRHYRDGVLAPLDFLK